MAWLVLHFDDEDENEDSEDYNFYEWSECTSNSGGVAQLVERLPCKQEVEGS